MHLQPAVVLNEAKFSEFVQENIHMGASGTDHFRQCLLLIPNQSLHVPSFPKRKH